METHEALALALNHTPVDHDGASYVLDFKKGCLIRKPAKAGVAWEPCSAEVWGWAFGTNSSTWSESSQWVEVTSSEVISLLESGFMDAVWEYLDPRMGSRWYPAPRHTHFNSNVLVVIPNHTYRYR